MEEAHHEAAYIYKLVAEYWNHVRKNEPDKQRIMLKELQETAINAAC